MDAETIGALTRPFNDVKTRPGQNGKRLQYIEGHAVIRRLNEAFGGEWSFAILEHQNIGDDVVVIGELRARGIVKHAFGGTDVTRNRETGKPISYPDDLKAAATDALKKAATLFGVGAHLYAQKAEKGHGSNGQGDREQQRVLSSNQLKYIHGLAEKSGLENGQLEAMSGQRFGREPKMLSSWEASQLIQQLQGLPG